MFKKKPKEFHRQILKPIDTEKEFEAGEAFKALRTNITFSMSQREHKRILFTSSVPAEGKTSTICNFAIVLAQTGSKVILIDGDMRNPKVHKIFGYHKTRKGLSTVLSTGSFEGSVVNSKYENLDLMFAGMTPPNPTELFEGKYAESFFDKLEQYYDYVLVDTPPVNLITDALVLNKYNFATIMVLREGYSDHREIQKAIKSIQLVGSDLIGAILIGSNHALTAVKKEGYGYGYRYGYGYGNYYGYKKDDDSDDEEYDSEN